MSYNHPYMLMFINNYLTYLAIMVFGQLNQKYDAVQHCYMWFEFQLLKISHLFNQSV